MRKLCLKLNNVEILHRRMGNLQGWMRYCFLVNRSLLLLLLLLSPCLIIIARFIQCTSVAVVVDRRERGSEGRRDGDGGGETEEREREREWRRGRRDRRETQKTQRTRAEKQRQRGKGGIRVDSGSNALSLCVDFWRIFFCSEQVFSCCRFVETETSIFF